MNDTEKPKEARLVVTLPDGRQFNSKALLFDGIEKSPIRLSLECEQWLREAAATFGEWLREPERFAGGHAFLAAQPEPEAPGESDTKRLERCILRLDQRIASLEQARTADQVRAERARGSTFCPEGVEDLRRRVEELEKRLQEQGRRHAALFCLLRSRGVVSDADNQIGGTG